MLRSHVELKLVPARVLEYDTEIKPIIRKIKDIVRYFEQSVIASDELRKQTKYTLIQSVSTRWGSTYSMLERYLTLSDVTASIIIKLDEDKVPAPLMGGEPRLKK